MKQTPFLAFSSTEQEAVVRALRRAGIPARGVCVSRYELPAAPSRPEGRFTTISTPSWSRTYAQEAGDWIRALESELAQAA